MCSDDDDDDDDDDDNDDNDDEKELKEDDDKEIQEDDGVIMNKVCIKTKNYRSNASAVQKHIHISYNSLTYINKMRIRRKSSGIDQMKNKEMMIMTTMMMKR